MSSEFKKTGLEWDEKREKEFNSLTRRIERSLVDIEKELKQYKTKPTIKLLAELSKCSKGALQDRASKHESDWPISELKRIQGAWRVIVKGALGTRSDAESYDTTTAESNAQGRDRQSLDDLKKRVRKYMEENSRLKYDLIEITEKFKQQTKSIELMNVRREELEHENAELKKKLSKPSGNRKSHLEIVK